MFPRLPPETSWRGEPSGSLNVPGRGTLTLPFIWECPFPVPLVLANLVDRALPRARPGRTGGGAPLPLRLPQGCLDGTLHPVLLTPGPSIRQCGSSGQAGGAIHRVRPGRTGGGALLPPPVPRGLPYWHPSSRPPEPRPVSTAIWDYRAGPGHDFESISRWCPHWCPRG
jgi:hypothetical protein